MLNITATIPDRPDLLLLFLRPETGIKNWLGSEASDSSQGPQKRILRCRACHTAITGTEQEISKQGRHEHAFFNPAGIAFEIRCFQTAPGCLVQGKPSAEFSWFVGYQWQYAVCAHCLTHLGWFFTTDLERIKGEDTFFALVTNKLVIL